MRRNLASLVVGGLALIGLGTAGYRAYQLRRIAKEQEGRDVIEVEPIDEDDSRNSQSHL